VIERLCIIGVGLIGGSLARALKDQHAVAQVVGCGRTVATLERALALGVIDRYALDVAEAVTDADMVVVAVPLGAMEPIFRQMRGGLAPSAALTDVGSAKTSVVEAARQAFGALPSGLVPGHPIAGAETSGVEASVPDLFVGHRVVLTPLPESDAVAVERVRRMWQTTGAQVAEMDYQHHDEVLAATSHVPHVLAYNLLDTLCALDASHEMLRYSAGSFRDFTRIAASDPTMWRDICIGNRAAVMAVLRRYTEGLERLSEAIADGDGEHLMQIFGRAKRTREHYERMMQDQTEQGLGSE